MLKVYRKDITAGESQHHLDAFWTEHWGGLGIEALGHGLERTDLWRGFRRWLPPGATVLEAGCGPGHWVKFLREKGYEAVGMDLSEPGLQSSLRVAPSLRVARGDLMATPFQNDAFDAYVSLGVIEHFEEGPQQVLAEALRVVKPGGIFLFSVPFMNWVLRFKLLRKEGKQYSDDSGVFYAYVLTRRELKRLLAQAGMEVLTTFYYEVEGSVQKRLPVVGELKAKIKENRSPWVQKMLPLLHETWDLFIRLLPAPALAHMIMAVCRKPTEGER